MNKLNIFKTLFYIAIISTLTISCSEEGDNNPGKTASVEKTKYAVAFEENKVGKEDEVDYILEISSKESLTKGNFDVKGKGIAQSGWRFFFQSQNTLFTAGYLKDVGCISYVIGQGKRLQEKAKFTFDKSLNIFTTTEDKKVLAVELHFGTFEKLRFHFINTETGKVENIIEREFAFDRGAGTIENPGTIPFITGMVQKNNKLYASYYRTSADGKTMTPNNNKAYVAIFSYPSLELDKIIEDDRTTQIGVNGGDTGIEITENGDMYTYSSSALSAGFTDAQNPSGILRIKNGSSEFDKDYFFDVENAPNGGKIYWMKYIADGKALARIILDDTKGAGAWGTFLTKDAVKMVVIDLNAKTVTDVDGVPNPHGQRYVSQTGILIEDGKVYTGVTNPIETAVYIIDVNSATATKGAVATNARSIKGIFKVEK